MSLGGTDLYPLVSVIVPSYNCESYISETLVSILGQSYRNLEVIVVDDGSTDNTSQVVKDLQNNDNRIIYLYKVNGGQPTARNEGLKAARGELVAFCDSDDIWLNEKIKLQVPFFEDPDIGACYTAMQRFDSVTGDVITDGQKFSSRWQGEITHHLLLHNFIGHSTILVRRSCFEQAGYFDPAIKMGDDWDMVLRLSMCTRFGYVDQVMVRYRMHRTGQITSNQFARKDWSLKILDKFMSRYPGQVPRSVIIEAKQNILVEDAWALREVSLWQSSVRYWQAFRLNPFCFHLLLSIAKNLFFLFKNRFE